MYFVIILGFARGILENGGPNPRQGKKTDNAHPPIHPLRYANNLQVRSCTEKKKRKKNATF